MILPVVLSGGGGTRLWPLSRHGYPKQFLNLLNEHSMLQDTILRLEGLPGPCTPPLVICNQDHRFLVAEQLQQIGVQPEAVLLEPVGRNTAPAIAMAALHACEHGGDDILLVLPADHVIRDPAAFHRAVGVGTAPAEEGSLVTFGIVPTAPETGYGYVRAGSQLPSGASVVDRFVEKPDRATAEAYLAGGDYYWNSGMFMFRASRYLEELGRHAPGMLSACRSAFAAARRDLDFMRLPEEEFSACPSDSVDYAVMEHTESAVLVPLDAGWSDVGSWSALWEVGAQDDAGNVSRGDVLAQDCRDCYLQSASRLLAVIGGRHLVIVETPDAVLVSPKDRVQEVKAIVDRLKASERPEARMHRKQYRPWGTSDAIDGESRFEVRRVTVKPGGSLLEQMHHHRSEHWIVVQGTAQVTRGEEVTLLTENQSTYIPPGTRHRLANPGRIPLEVIEVRSGSYLGEDDVVRFGEAWSEEASQ